MPLDSYLFFKSIKPIYIKQKPSQPTAKPKRIDNLSSSNEVKVVGSLQYMSLLQRKHSSAYLEELESPKKEKDKVSRQVKIALLLQQSVIKNGDFPLAKAYLLEEITDKIFILFTQIVNSTSWNERRQTTKRLAKVDALKTLLALVATHEEIEAFDNRFIQHFKISPLVIYPEELKWQGITTLEQLETSPRYAKLFKLAFKSKLKLTSDVKDIFLAAKTYLAYKVQIPKPIVLEAHSPTLPLLRGFN